MEDLFADIDRVIDIPNKHSDEVKQLSGIKPLLTNRFISMVEWMEDVDSAVTAIFVDKDTFEALKVEYEFCHTGVTLGDCNMIVMTTRSKKQFAVMLTKEVEDEDAV